MSAKATDILKCPKCHKECRARLDVRVPLVRCPHCGHPLTVSEVVNPERYVLEAAIRYVDKHGSGTSDESKELWAAVRAYERTSVGQLKARSARGRA